MRQRKLAPLSSANDASHENFFDLSVDMLCVAGYDGYFKRLNPAWTQTLGFTQAELTARPYMDFVHPDDRLATVAEAEKLTQGAKVIHFRNRYQCRDGTYRWLAWAAMPAGSERESPSAMWCAHSVAARVRNRSSGARKRVTRQSGFEA